MMTKTTDILLITPPIVSAPYPYPATPYLKGYLSRKGFDVKQCDLSIELLNIIYSSCFLKTVFDMCEYAKGLKLREIVASNKISNALKQTIVVGKDYDMVKSIIERKDKYLRAIDVVMDFLHYHGFSAEHLICSDSFLPHAWSFSKENFKDLDKLLGSSDTTDRAFLLCSFFLDDVKQFLQETVSYKLNGIVTYGMYRHTESTFEEIEEDLRKPLDMIEQKIIELLDIKLKETNPKFVGITVPFEANTFQALRCAKYIKENYSDIKTILGGGCVSTKLREIQDKAFFKYVDYAVLDDGELALERILTGGKLIRTHTINGYESNNEQISHEDRGYPDYEGLPLNKYFTHIGLNRYMQNYQIRDYNALILAHGCYWAKCSFCDTLLDYVCRYDAVSATTTVDWMEKVYEQTGWRGFHFVDEAAPPKLLKEMSIELLRRKHTFIWKTNIRFEKAYTEDLCRLLAAAGGLLVMGGLEVASDRVLKIINKGITIEQSAIVMQNFKRAGIMTHAYLMYGLPTESLQESIDSMEVVRQMFKENLIQSGVWAKYVMTKHSTSGRNPEAFGVVEEKPSKNMFFQYGMQFKENRDYDLEWVSMATEKSMKNYRDSKNMDKPVHEWFEENVPHTTVSPTLIKDIINNNDTKPKINANNQLIWIGDAIERTTEGVKLISNKGEQQITVANDDADFMVEVVKKASDLNIKTTLGLVKDLYEQKYPEKSFTTLYESEVWDAVHQYGLLQV